MGNEIDWKSIPGLSAKVIKTLAGMPVDLAFKAFTALKESNGSAARITSEQIESYKSTDQGDASGLAVESNASGRTRPVNETFAGSGVPISRSENGDSQREATFATRRDPFAKQEVDPGRYTGRLGEINPTTDVPAAAADKKDSTYTRSTALRDDSGSLLTTEGLSGLKNDDLLERYKTFFGAEAKDFKTAKTELEDLLKDTKKQSNPLLD